MNQSIETVKAFLDRHDIHYDQLGDRVLRTDLDGRNGLLPAFLELDDEKGSLLVISIFPATVAQSRQAAVAELLMRINWTLVLGNFEMDMEDGHVRFRTSIRLGDAGLNEEAVTHVFFANMVLMDHHLPALNAVAFGSISPASALQGLEDPRTTTSAASPPHPPVNRMTGFFDASSN